jgi:hypothetical protein
VVILPFTNRAKFETKIRPILAAKRNQVSGRRLWSGLAGRPNAFV